jgi:hypothetical protein
MFDAIGKRSQLQRPASTGALAPDDLQTFNPIIVLRRFSSAC